MICRALGYTAQAKELVGAWPANYIALGQQLGLYDDVAATATTDRASAAQIIYNALTVPVKYINADGDTRPLTDGNGDDVTMLGSLGGNKVNGGNGFVLDSTMAEAAVINVNEYVGQFVSAFCNNDGDIIAVEVLSTTVSGDYDNGTFSTDDVDYYFDGTNNYDYTAIAATGAKTANTAPMHIVDGKTSAVALPALGEGMTLAVKLSGKTITEVYSCIEWGAVAIDQFEDGDLNIEKAKINVDGTDYKFKTDKNGDIDANSFALVGVASLDKIAEDNVIEVYVAGGLITKIAVGTKTVTGECTEITKKANGNDNKYVIDGVKYASANEKPAVGETGTAYLNYDGDIAFWSADDATADNYGVFVAYEDSSKLGTLTTTVRLITKDGKQGDYTYASNAKFTDEVTSATSLSGIGANDIVKYAFNSKGEISSIKTITTAAITGDGKANAGKTRIGNTSVSTNVLVFMKDGSDWSVVDFKSVSTDYVFVAANKVKVSKDKIVALTINKADALGTESSFGLITSVSEKANADGNSQFYVKGFVDGKAFEGFVDDSVTTANITKSGVGADGLYTIELDGEGAVINITRTAIAGRTSAQAVTANLAVKSVDKTNKEITCTNGAVYGLTSDVVVYFYDEDDGYVLSSVDNIGKGKLINLLATGSKAWDDGLYNVVIFWNAE